MAIVSVAALEKRLSNVEVPVLRERASSKGKMATASAREIFRNYRQVIPSAIRTKLAANTATGDRSRVLWRINCALLECGLQPGEVVVLVEGSVWNKFEDDRSRLWADVNKARDHLSSKQVQQRATRKKKPQRARNRSQPWAVPLDRYLAIESRDPQWMIEGLWSTNSHGIIAAEPKARKSYLALDIALSVATGKPCLGYFPVKQKGPVVMVQEEISDSEMKKRIRHIIKAKKLQGKVSRRDGIVSVQLPDPIEMYLRNRQQFDLTNTDHLDELAKHILDVEAKLLILDPLQMMLGSANENHAHEVRPILQNMLKLKEATGCGVMIVHHYGKDSEKRGGQRMLGSQAFHGWVESALYLSKPEPYITKVEREFRNFDPMPPFEIEYLGGNEGYHVAVTEQKPRKPMSKFEKWCTQHPDTPIKALAKALKTTDMQVRRLVDRSPYLEIRRARVGSNGRPQSVVGRARVDA